MDDAVKVACAFAERHPDDTLILVTGDHETGGLAMGFVGTGSKFHIHLLERQKTSTESFMKRIHGMLEKDPGLTFESVKPLVTENFGLIFDASAAKTADDRLLVLSKAEISGARSSPPRRSACSATTRASAGAPARTRPCPR